MNKTKPYFIPKEFVLEAWEKVRRNKGSAGIDNETIKMYEKDLKANLYKLWNRMSSGSYFPPPVKLVEIDKDNGGKRPLGIPTVSDRIAQMVCKMYLEPTLERIFHKDSYGYRPFKSAKHAVKTAKQRCLKYDWVIDIDIKGFFDNINHDLMMKAVKKHADREWMILYIERWLKADAITDKGEIIKRTKGTPQGGVISPILANLFLHYAFDKWMEREYAHIPFERYADDCIIHCKTKKQADCVLSFLKSRLKECGLELNKEKTKIVYCKDTNRWSKYDKIEFDFLSFTFKRKTVMRKHRWKKYYFGVFSPDISRKSQTKIKNEMKKWNIKSKCHRTIQDLSKMYNNKIRGWINYFEDFSSKSTLYSLFYKFNCMLVKWAMSKHKKFRRKWKKAYIWLGEIAVKLPKLFSHWEIGIKPMVGQ